MYPLSRGFCPPGTGGRAGWPAPFIKLPARTRQTDDPSVLQSDLRFRDNNVSAALRFRGKKLVFGGRFGLGLLLSLCFCAASSRGKRKGDLISLPGVRLS